MDSMYRECSKGNLRYTIKGELTFRVCDKRGLSLRKG